MTRHRPRPHSSTRSRSSPGRRSRHCTSFVSRRATRRVDSETELSGYDAAHEYARDLLEAAVLTAADRDHEIETVIKTGHSAREIGNYAIDNGFDRIVIGSHGRKRASRGLYGRVSERIVRHAPMTVVVVHES